MHVDCSLKPVTYALVSTCKLVLALSLGVEGFLNLEITTTSKFLSMQLATALCQLKVDIVL